MDGPAARAGNKGPRQEFGAGIKARLRSQAAGDAERAPNASWRRWVVPRDGVFVCSLNCGAGRGTAGAETPHSLASPTPIFASPGLSLREVETSV